MTRAAACDYLWSLGLDPRNVLEAGMTSESYRSMVKTENGIPDYEYGVKGVWTTPWPDGFDWVDFCRTWARR